MTRINLLPWREQQREQEKKRFILFLLAGVVLASFIVFLIHCYASNRVNNQISRNQMVQQEIVVYDRQLKEIKNLEKVRSRLFSRMSIVRNLQSTRTLMAHLFDELIKVTPLGVYISKIEGKNNIISLSGYAESNTSVSLEMKNIENDVWLHRPVLREIKNRDDKSQAADNEFKLTFVLGPKSPLGVVHE